MNSIENVIFLFCFGYKLNQFFSYANTMLNGRLVFMKKRVAEEVPEKEDKKMVKRNIKIETKVNLPVWVCVVGVGIGLH